MAEGSGGQPKPRKSRAKGRTSQEQFSTAQQRIEQAKHARAATLDLSDLIKLAELPREVAHLVAPQRLDLSRTQVRDLAPLAGLTGLEVLNLNRTRVRDLAPLVGLVALQVLNLNGTQVSDLAPLAGLTNLQFLWLDGTQVSDLAPLAGLTALQRLDLSGTQVSDLAPLAGLTALQRLDLSGTQVSDLAPLADLPALQFLDLSGTQVRDLAPLAGLAALQFLDLMDTQVSDLAPLGGLALEGLLLDDAHVSNLAPLADLVALRRLSITDTKVSDLTPLAGLTNLQFLWLDGTQVSDLAPLGGLAALQLLDLSGTQVSNLAPLARLTSLSDAAERGEGLTYAGTPAARDAPFNQLASLPRPVRTVETINEMRRQQGLPEHIPDGYEQPEELTASASAMEPIPGVPSPFGFEVRSGKISLTPSSADLPVFPLPTSERDHGIRLETSRTLADDLAADLKSGKFNARSDYAESLTKYAQRLPRRPGGGNILLADAEARTLRNMFEADADFLPVGLGSKLKTMLEQHIGLRVYYPEIEHLYRDVQNGRIETPLPLDAVQGIVRTVRAYTPEVFEPPVGDAVASSATRTPEILMRSEGNQGSADPTQPKPPPDPLGEIDPRKARDVTVAGAINGLWKAFKEGEKIHKAIKGWKNAGNALRPHVQQVLDWLRNFAGPGDIPPPMPPGLST